MYQWAIAAVTGSDHLAADMPSQDGAFVASFEHTSGRSWIVAVVTDGAGSAAYGGVGAQRLATAFVAAIKVALSSAEDAALDGVMRAALASARNALAAQAAEQEQQLQAFATTVCGYVGTSDRHGFIQVGDGAMIAGPPWAVVLKPQRGEHANETVFVTCDDWQNHVATRVIDGGDIACVALMTDGVRDLLVRHPDLQPNTPLLDGLREELAETDVRGFDVIASEQIESFLDCDAIRAKSTDDLTLAVVRIIREI